MTVVRRVARPLLASLFIWEGIDAMLHPQERAERATGAVRQLHELAGLPDDPVLMVRINGAIMVTAGAALALGKAPRAAATTLAAIMVPTTYAGQAFWTESDPEVRRRQRQSFVRNLSLTGGLLIAAADTAGKPSLGYRLRSNRAARKAKKSSVSPTE